MANADCTTRGTSDDRFYGHISFSFNGIFLLTRGYLYENTVNPDQPASHEAI